MIPIEDHAFSSSLSETHTKSLLVFRLMLAVILDATTFIRAPGTFIRDT